MKTLSDKISLCMITKDEEDFLSQCLDSVKSLVDEIVIVDTGSTDKTVDIAKSYGAKVHHHPWENDYSKHRNQSISYATGDWILMMDADEVIAARDLDRIRLLLRSRDADGFTFVLRNYERQFVANLTLNPNDYEEGNGYPGFIAVPLIRLFRNDPAIFFTGRVHEAVSESFGRSRKTYRNSGIPIHHYGKVRADRLKRKQGLYLELGIARLKESPYDPIAYKGLAEQYLELGMPGEALEVLDRAVTVFPEIIELRFNRGLSLDRLNRCEEAETEYVWILERKPDHIGACHNLAQIHISENRVEEAIHLLNRGIDLGLRHPGMFFLLGRAYYAAGNWENGLINFDRALEMQPDCPNVNCHRAVVFLDRKMYGAAINALEREIEINGNLVDAYNLLGQMSLVLKDLGSAAQFFQKVLTINPSEPTAKAHLERMNLSG